MYCTIAGVKALPIIRPKIDLAGGDNIFGFLAGIKVNLEAIAIAVIEPNNQGRGSSKYINIMAPISPIKRDRATCKKGMSFLNNRFLSNRKYLDSLCYFFLALFMTIYKL